MSLVTTMGKYCFIACDGPNCNKKIEHVDQKILKQLVRLCGWYPSDDEWFCSDCAAKLHIKAPPEKGQEKSFQGRPKASQPR